MITRLNTTQPDFAARYAELLALPADCRDVEGEVAAIIQRVRTMGDAAVCEFTHRFDRLAITPANLEITPDEVAAAVAALTPELMNALRHAAERIAAYHRWQLPRLGVDTYRDATGTLLGQRTSPLQRVGLYVPGGIAAYPSSVLMNAVPAKVAGVPELIMVVPTPDGQLNPMVLAAASISGVDRIFRIGGAQAVAALAFGTATVPRVDKIVGPGNIYVATAKRQVFGAVGIDMIAGPSEILIIADSANNPEWLAADLLSQAEHDTHAQAILITPDPQLADAVERAVARHLTTLSRSAICRESLASRGVIIVAGDLAEACRLASQAAPEHLELAVEEPEAWLSQIEHAGAIFMGRYTPEPLGDYIAGPDHVLPTAGTARFSSPLGVYDFLKRTSIIGCTAESLARLGPDAARLAAGEGLTAHQLSVELRLDEPHRNP